MKMNFSDQIGKSPLRDAGIFIALTIIGSWVLWLPGALLKAVGAQAVGNLLLALGSFVPFAVALYLSLWAKERAFDWRGWLRSLTLRRIVLALVLPFLILFPIVLSRLYEDTFDLLGFIKELASAPFLFVGLAVLSFGEEFGWRGYLLKRLDSLNLIVVNFIVAFAWFIWQIPLILSAPTESFLGDTRQQVAAFLLFSLFITPFLNRLATRANWDVLVPTLLRACLRTVFAVYVLQGSLTVITHPYGFGVLAWLAVLNAVLFGQLWQGKPAGDESELQRVMPLEAAIR